MDQETLFTSSKWDILKIISHEKKSPLELSKLAKTSVANISQQLRLLEFAGIVKSERIPNREKDKPRILYSLAKDTSYIISVAENFVEKSFVPADNFTKTALRIFFVSNPALHYFLQKAFWRIEPHLGKIEAIFLDAAEQKDIILYAATDAATKKSLRDFTIKHTLTSESKNVKFKFVDEKEARSLSQAKKQSLYPIYLSLSYSKFQTDLREVEK